jgi:hypothetical protein
MATKSKEVEEEFPTVESVVEKGTRIANKLMEVVEQQQKAGKEMYSVISGKKYLRVESWAILIEEYDVNPNIISLNSYTDKDGNIMGYEARCELQIHDAVHGGTYVVAAGVMSCGMDEWPTRGKHGEDKRRACMSAAQTWAMSKAARLKYGWVPMLVGYESLPYEELTDSAGQIPSEDAKKMSRPAPVSKPQQAESDNYWCAKHQTKWFLSPRMAELGRKHAHPTDGGPWCEMPSDLSVTKQPTNGVPASLSSFKAKMSQLKITDSMIEAYLGYSSIEEFVADSDLSEAEATGEAFKVIKQNIESDVSQ